MRHVLVQRMFCIKEYPLSTSAACRARLVCEYPFLLSTYPDVPLVFLDLFRLGVHQLR